MARKFLQPIDLTQLELLNVRLQQLGSDPGSPVEGQLWYRSDLHRPRWNDGTSTWSVFPSVSTNTNNTEVLRDGSGNFSAGTITASLTGTASQATTLDDGTTTYRSGSYYLNFANSTGTRTHTAISDFDTQVRTSRLDQMAAPTASVSMNSQLLTNLLDPVSAQDAATKGYVDATATGLDVKGSVRVATAAALPAYTRTANVITATSNAALAAVDGVTLVLNDRLLVKNGASGTDNGIYFVSQVGSVGTPYTLTRTTDADTSAEVTPGMFVFVEEGTTLADTGWVLTTNAPITLNTTALTFTQFSGAGTYVAGNGITITGTTIAASLAARLTFTGATIDLASGIVTAGTYTSVTVDTYGRVTAGADIVTSNGIVARTASGTFTNRTITGTASRITLTNGDGVAGNPTVDIHASYVGQASITTLGTIGTGTWQGTAVGTTYGGTGLDTHLAANGSLLIGNGSGLTLATLTAGTNISISNGVGSITINTTGVPTGSGATNQVAFWSGTSVLTGNASYTYVAATGLTVGAGSTPLSLTQSVVTSGSPTALSLTGGAHTTLAASTEAIDVNFNLARTVQFATGALATQRAVVFQAPTYAFVAASTITTAATVAITGNPVTGTNAAITKSHAFWVQAGRTQLDGALVATSTTQLSGTTTFDTSTTNIIVTQGVATSGSPASVTVTGGAHTTLAASTEASDVVVNLARTVQFATGALTTQRAVRIAAPTYGFVASSTLTTAATFAISGAPVQGTNATITNAYALWVQGGTSRFDGDISLNDGNNIVLGTTTGTKIGTSTSQKLGFYNSAPVVQQTGDVATALSTLGLIGSPTISATTALDGTFSVKNTADNTKVFNWSLGGMTTAKTLTLASIQTTTQTITIPNITGSDTFAVLGLAQTFTAAKTFQATTTLNTATANLVVTQGVASSGSPTSVSITGGAHTTLAASTEAPDVDLALNRTVQFATGALTTQRAVVVRAPTYGFVASSTLTNAATFAITGAPVQGTNATLTNTYALWVQGGTTRLDGQLNIGTTSVPVVVVQGVAATGSPTALSFTGGAHTTLTASTEAVDINWALNRTVQFATGALATQRAFLVQAPTYGFVGSSTLTTAATFAISGAPVQGTNATITNSYALWVQGGVSRFDGNVSFNDAVNVVLGTSTGTKIGTSTSQKLGFFNATPVVQQTGDISTALSTLGLVTSGTLAGTSITGLVGVANGGTGLSGASAANGTLLIGNGSGYTLATLTAGTNVSITNAAGSITINSTGPAKFAVSVGNGASTAITVTHNLGTLDVTVTVYDNSTLAEVFPDVVHATTNTLTVSFAVAPTSNQYRVVVTG